MIPINHSIKLNNVSKVINDYSPSFSGIVSQESKGKLWVDNITVPAIAIAESFAVGSFAFLGVQKAPINFAKLKDFLENELFCSLKKDGYECFEFSIESESLRAPILEMFQDEVIHTEKEFSLRINSAPLSNQPIQPKEYQIRKVDALFWTRLIEGRFENEDFLMRRLLESWSSFEVFEKRSVAYCTLYKNRIVAVMVGTASFNHIIAIDIETESNHQRKGLAYAMGVEFITDCLSNELILQWDCVESNPNSYHLAKKLGFEKIHENIVYWFDL